MKHKYVIAALCVSILAPLAMPSKAEAFSLKLNVPTIGVFDKADELGKVKRELQKQEATLANKSEQLETTVANQKNLVSEIANISASIEEVKSQIEEKNAREQAERERVERERAEAEALLATTVQITRSAPNSAGNAYAWGNCTYYVKNKRPDIGSFWGNANQWLASASRDGFAIGSTPKAGAIGVTLAGVYGHVVYVEAVNPDGSVLVSEMNYQGLNVISQRSTSASEFSYIYSAT